MAHLQEMPDRVVILVRHGVVRVVPVHEVCEALRLLRLHVGESADPRLAVLHELADAVRLDVSLRPEALFLFDLHLYPQPLAVETVLEPLLVALHVPETKEQVLVGSAPGVVDAHGVVGRDRAVYEREGLLGGVVAVQVSVDDARLVPPLEQPFFHRHEIGLRGDRLKGSARHLLCKFSHGFLGFRCDLNALFVSGTQDGVSSKGERTCVRGPVIRCFVAIYCPFNFCQQKTRPKTGTGRLRPAGPWHRIGVDSRRCQGARSCLIGTRGTTLVPV